MNKTVQTLCIIVVSVACLVPSFALAQDADALIERGIELREQRQDAEALAVFEEAHRLRPTARSLTQIALAEQALERFLPAVRHLGEALQSSDPWIEERRGVLEDTLAAAGRHVSRISVNGEPAGAEVLLDGTPIGTLPTSPAWVMPSTVTVEVRAPGHAPLREQVTLSAGEHVRHRVILQPDGELGEPGAQSSSDAASSDAYSGSGGGSIHPAGPIVMGVGGAMLIGGVILGVLTLDADSRLAAMCDGMNCYPSAQSILDERRSFALTSDVLLFGGGLVAALGLVLTFVLSED